MLNKTLGRYVVPEELILISELDIEFSTLHKYDSLLGATIHFGDGRYFNTPLDVIPFGWTGGNGIHLGFLTDFSTCKTLDDAYVVCVSPMDFDKPVTILSRNIRELLGLWIATGDPSFMDYFKHCTSEEQFNHFLKKNERDLYERSKKLEPYFQIIQQHFDIEAIPDVYQYLLKLQQRRCEEVVLQTQDGLGVVSYTSGQSHHSSYKITKEARYDMDEISVFLSTSSIESKLALIRDLQLNYVLWDEYDLKEIIYHELMTDGFEEEATILKRDL